MVMTRKSSGTTARPSFLSYWLSIWVWFYLAIIVLGLAMPGSTILTIIRLSGIFGCIIYVKLNFPRDHLLFVAMLLTFCADILLTIGTLSDHPILITTQLGVMEFGVITFFAAQITHMLRLGERALWPAIWTFTGVAAIMTGVNIIFNFCPLMPEICTFYVAALSLNILASARWLKRDHDNLVAKFALIGFFLFLSCDICTGISYLGTNSIFPAFVIAPANFMAWFFYYPSQIFISNSTKYVKIKSKQEIVL